MFLAGLAWIEVDAGSRTSTAGLARNGRRRGTAAVVALLALAALLSYPQWSGDIDWVADGLFYQAQMLQVRGMPEQESLKKVFNSGLEPNIIPPIANHYDAAWENYSKQFYRRRWLVSTLGAPVYPIFGTHTLKDVSILAYLLLGPALYLLLRRRFSRPLALGVAAGILLLPPVRYWSFRPMTDSWALLLEVVCLGLALLAIERGLRWLPAWIAGIVALSFTRDTTVVLVLATAWVAIAVRSRRAAVLSGTGLLASLPAVLLFGTPVRQNLAYLLSDFQIPRDSSWGFVKAHYPAKIVEQLHLDARYPIHQPLPVLVTLAGFVVLAGVAFLFVRAPRRDPFFALMQASVVGGVIALVPSLNYTIFRLELVFVPAVAVGVALVAERAAVPARALARRHLPEQLLRREQLAAARSSP